MDSVQRSYEQQERQAVRRIDKIKEELEGELVEIKQMSGSLENLIHRNNGSRATAEKFLLDRKLQDDARSLSSSDADLTEHARYIRDGQDSNARNLKNIQLAHIVGNSIEERLKKRGYMYGTPTNEDAAKTAAKTFYCRSPLPNRCAKLSSPKHSPISSPRVTKK